MSDNSKHGAGLPEKIIESQLDPVFKAAIDSKRVPGAAAIALNASGKVLFSKGYGTTAFGVEGAPKVTTKTPVYIASCTKLFTSIAALQLWEQKKLGLSDYVDKYVPEFAKLPVLTGFDDQGKPTYKIQGSAAMIIHLLTHTAGLTYDFFDKDTLQYRVAKGETPATYNVTTTLEYFSTPLKFNAGTAYNYGVNTDWLGLVIEKASGLRVDRYIQKYILEPLGLKDTRYGAEGNDFFNIHLKDENGKLTPLTNARNNTEGGIVPGGQYLTSTAEDYAQLLLTVLNNGTHPISKVTLLKPDTVKKFIFQDQLAPLGVSNKGVGEIVSSIPQFSCGGTMLPGITKGWSLGLMTNSENLPNGRKAGSGGWAGLTNCYYWMDPASGKLGFVISSSFPWFDKDVLHLFDSLERAVYAKPLADYPGQPGSNFSGGNWWRG